MIRTKLVEEKLRQQRLHAKSLDNLFRRRIEQGANCSPFVSGAILQTVKDVFPVSPQDSNNTLGLGQINLRGEAESLAPITRATPVQRHACSPNRSNRDASSGPPSP